MAVLRGCTVFISRALETGASVLLAAKVLVISRLLHKKLSQRPESPPYLEKLRKRLSSLRRRLLGRIDSRMRIKKDLSGGPLEAMIAFALATSASASDVLRHLLHVRQEAVLAAAVNDGTESGALSKSLEVYFGTLRDVKTLVPAALSNALQKVKQKPLLDDQDLYHLAELNLDLHGKRLGDDIRSFTPYVRHDDLSKADVGKVVQGWSEQTLSMMLDEIQAQLQTYDDPLKLAKMRRQILELWFSNQQHVNDYQRTTFTNKLRKLFVERWLKVIEEDSSSLIDIGKLLQEAISSSSDADFAVDLSLWTSDLLSFDPSDEAIAFRDMLVSRSQGDIPSFREVQIQYDTWRARIDKVSQSIETLSTEKWQDILDVYDEDLADEQSNSAIESALNREDPQTLQESLGSRLGKVFQELEARLRQVSNDADSINPHKLAFLFRVLRYIRQHLPQCYNRSASSSSFAIPIIENVHHQLASTTVRHPIENSLRPLTKLLISQTLRSKSLWEGSPPLPTLPSPWAFTLLQSLSGALSSLGADIWSPASISAVKYSSRSKLGELLENVLHHLGQKIRAKQPEVARLTNGAEQEQESIAERDSGFTMVALGLGSVARDVQTQLLFDLLYLSDALHDSHHHHRYPTGHKTQHEKEGGGGVAVSEQTQLSPEAGIDTVVATTAIIDHDNDKLITLRTRIETETALQATETGRMERAAEEYWRRTGLLFGLLNS